MQSLGGSLRKIGDSEGRSGGNGRRRLVYSNMHPEGHDLARPRPRARRGYFSRLFAPLEGLKLPNRVGMYGAAALFSATGAFGAVVGDHLDSIGHGVFATANYVTASVGFGIDSVVITGHKEVSEIDVLRALEIGDTTSLLTFDAHWARQKLGQIAWVKSATVQKLFPGTLRVDLNEREPYALWQLTGIVSLIDRDGEVIGELGEERFAGLPLVVGSGANKRVDELMALVRPHPSVATRLRAAVLVADRRWNLMLDNGVEVRLPEDGAELALTELDRMTAENGLMGRDITLVDLRLADRVVVRLSDEAAVQRKAAIKSQGSKPQRKGQDT